MIYGIQKLLFSSNGGSPLLVLVLPVEKTIIHLQYG